MAKVTEQDVVSFLKEKVDQISRDLEFVRNTLNVIEGISSQEAAPEKGNAANKAPSVGMKASKADGEKRGRKPNVKKIPSERVLVADQLG